ncbi:MAG: WD40 repeat domain-containing protein, partial [Acidobacteria bacterium]|nr:WD40 repeat domain-containing protein [Acidobacteriota bacterium]
AEKEEQERRIRDAERIAEEQKKAAEAQKKEAATQRRSVRNTRIGLVVAVALLAIASLAGWQALREAQRADHQARTATAQKLAAQARVHFAQKPDLAVLLSSEASRLDDSVEVKASLLDSLEHDGRLQTFLRGHTAPVQCVAFSRDGKFMATGGNDHTIHLWNAQTWQLLGTFPEGHKEPVFSLAFSPDSALLASGSTDQTVRLWNVATREPAGQPLTGHTGWVRSVVFLPDGKMLLSSSATESGENETLQWDLSSQPPSKKAVGEHMAGNLAVSPDGRLLAIGRGQRSISLWDLQTHSLRGNQLQTEGVFVQSLAFSSDSKTLAASDDKGIGLWDLSGSAPKSQEIADNVDFTLAVAISPDGKLLAGGGNDTVVHLWDLTTNRQLPRPLVGHKGYVTSLAFHPDGTTLVSGSEDGTLIKWSLIPRSPVRHLLPGGVGSAAFSPDEHWLVTDGADATILVW